MDITEEDEAVHRKVRENPLMMWKDADREPRVLVLRPGDSLYVRDDGGTNIRGVWNFQRLLVGAGVASLALFPDTDAADVVAMARRGRRQLVVNCLAEPDLHPGSLRVAGEICRHFPTINQPEHILRHTRDGVSERLQVVTGVVAPRCVRFTAGDDALGILPDLPAILRRTGTSTGRTAVLVTDNDAATAFMREHHGKECYATRFHDFRSADGWYRKYRVWMVGGAPVPIHLMIDDGWNVHGHSARERMASTQWMIDEEAAFLGRLLDASLAAAFRLVHERVGADFYGIDYAILPSGEALIFEVNASMRLLSPYSRAFKAMQQPILDVNRLFRELVVRKITAGAQRQ